MTGPISACLTGSSWPGLLARTLTCAVLLAWLAVFAMPAASAEESARPAALQQAGDGNVAPSNPGQASPAGGAPAVSPPSAIAADDVGILFLRSDGGDPKELRADARNTVIFIARRNGEGHAYRDGSEIGIDPAVKEAAGQIAAAQFAMPAGTALAVTGLPAMAQHALNRFNGGMIPRVLFAHLTSRADTARVSEQRAAKILAMETSANAERNIVALVKMAMQMFGLKSDACDNSLDSRCDEPGVREAFAAIKREEAQQHAQARF
jgi:hypothetical protein